MANDPAFPVLDSSGDGPFYCRFFGLTLLDYFAGQALPAVIAATCAGQHMPQMLPGDQHIRMAIARDAYAMGEAMLAARAALSEKEAPHDRD